MKPLGYFAFLPIPPSLNLPFGRLEKLLFLAKGSITFPFLFPRPGFQRRKIISECLLQRKENITACVMKGVIKTVDCIKEADYVTVSSPIGFWT